MTRVLGDKDFWWLFDAAAEAMLLTDVGGVILARNASCDRLFGYAAAEWGDIHVEDLSPARYRAAHNHFRAAFAAKPDARGMGRGGEFCGLRKDGTEFPARISLSAVPGADGPVVLAIIEDVTAQREAQEALREREALLGLAVRVTGLAPWEWKLGSDELSLSPEWKTQLGYSDDELPGRAAEWRSRLHPDDVAEFGRITEDFRRGSRRELDFKYRLRHRDGRFRWLQSRAVALPAQAGEGVRILGMQWDVTDQEKMAHQVGEWRGQVESARQLQVALETAALIAHDLNQPLNAVMSLCEAARMFTGQDKAEQLQQALAGAVKQAERASQVVRDVLASLERREISAAPMDLNRVIGDAASLILADELPGLRIVQSLRPDLPRVLGDEIQIKKVVVNLLRNGAEAMAAGGLSGRPITVTVSTDREQGMAQVSIRDEGPGPDPAAVKRLFEPFFTTKPRGIGMGLATSRRTIERFGGRLWFDSGAGGVTFHFTLPFAP